MEQAEGAADARAVLDLWHAARCTTDLHEIVRDGVINLGGPDLLAEIDDRLNVCQRAHARAAQIGHLQAGVVALHNAALCFGRAVLHKQFEQESVQLGLRQRIRAFELHRVLRRYHQEHRRELEPLTFDRDLVLFHCFQERGLGFGRRALHLIGDDNVGEDGASPETEGGVLHAEDVGAEDVGRHQVRRELDALKLSFDQRRQRTCHQGLGGAGDALDQDVAAHQQSAQQEGEWSIQLHQHAPRAFQRGLAELAGCHGLFAPNRDGNSSPGREAELTAAMSSGSLPAAAIRAAALGERWA